MKFSKFLATYILTIIILVASGYCVLERLKSEIYFNMWLNQVVEKSKQGALFNVSDLESGLALGGNGYKINNTAFEMRDLQSYVKYDKKTKTLSIFFSIPKVEDNISYGTSFNEIDKNTSKAICRDVYLATMHYSSLVINGEESISNISDFVKLLKCNFLSENKDDLMAPSISTGGWMFKTKGSDEPTEINGE